jgi:hypothetical protein
MDGREVNYVDPVPQEPGFTARLRFAQKVEYHPREWVVRSDRIYQKRYQHAFRIPPTAVGGWFGLFY